jgi:hypothetical protein
MLVDLVNEVLCAQALPPQILTATAQGSAIDMSDCLAGTGAIIDVGAITAANVTSLVVQIEECATTNGTFTAIPGMVATITATTTPGNLHQVVRGLRTQQFARANAATFAATTTTGAFPVNVEIVAQKKYVGIAGQLGGFDNYPGT